MSSCDAPSAACRIASTRLGRVRARARVRVRVRVRVKVWVRVWVKIRVRGQLPDALLHHR